MNARFERRLSRIESRNIGDPFDSLSDDELSALIEAIKENIDADEAVRIRRCAVTSLERRMRGDIPGRYGARVAAAQGLS